MKLTKIYFDAYKSLLKKTLEVKDDCIGFVGTNESGKSNILHAITIMDEQNMLSMVDLPKMDKQNNPSLRFGFRLSESENKKCQNLIEEWKSLNTSIKSEIKIKNEIIYKVEYNRDSKSEERSFIIEFEKIAKDIFALKKDKISKNYKIRITDKYVPLEKALLITKEELQNDLTRDRIKELSDITADNYRLELEIQSMKSEKAHLENGESIIIENNGSNLLVSTVERKALERKKAELEKNIQKIHEIEQSIVDFNINSEIERVKMQIDQYEGIINKLKDEKFGFESIIKEQKAINPQSDETKKAILVQQASISQIDIKIQENEKKLSFSRNLLEELDEPLDAKYVDDSTLIAEYVKKVIVPFLREIFPRVVFWEYNNNYILKSETLFTDILQKNSLTEISRPLANLFILGFGVRSLEEIKQKIAEIQNDSSERSRSSRILNVKINEYIKKVWEDYDQQLNISLEKDQIRVEFFDPKNNENASYYSMQERSQGCQSFFSFLLTIGAELKSGVLDNTILLLDEPETHLHPSGARYMLQELIKISQKGNQVFYATHSIFLIDRKNLNRHIILEKIKEETNIKYANLGRVGYFMQEEVIYSSLDVHLNSDFTDSKKYNFIFEGDGDVKLFEFYYDKVLSEKDRPFKLEHVTYFQGGKCSDIQKIFRTKSLHLNSKWIFILDSDKPANDLKKFLEDTYRDYIGKNIFVFQYISKRLDCSDCELEDLLPNEILQETVKTTFAHFEQEAYQYDEKLSYSINYNHIKDIMNNFNEVAFKEIFKSTLNQNIHNKLESCKKADFKNIFLEYFEWVSKEVTENLKTK